MKAIITKYHPQTGIKGARYSASDEDGNRVYLSFDCGDNADQRHRAAAKALCQKMNWSGAESLVMGELKPGTCVHVFPTDPAQLAAQELKTQLIAMVRYITSGEHYEEGNPYGKPTVRTALELLAKVRGIPDWLDGADLREHG